MTDDNDIFGHIPPPQSAPSQDDLFGHIPPPIDKPNIDWNKVGLDPSSARNYINSLPFDQQGAARNEWADTAVRNAYTNMPETAQNVIGGYHRAFSNIPGLGAWAPRLEGARQYVSSGFAPGSYEMGKALENAHLRYLEQQPSTKLLETPIGDVYTSGLEKAAGVVGGSALMPWGRAMKGTGFVPGAVNTGINTGVYSGIEGLGEGEGDIGDRLTHAGAKTAVGVGTGAILGGPLEKVAKQFEPRAAAAFTRDVPNEMAVAEAAQRAGVNVPKFLAGSGTAQEIAQISRYQPISGQVVQRNAERAVNELGDAAGRASEKLSTDLGTGATAGALDATSAAHEAGDLIKDDLLKWHRVTKKNELSQDYTNLYSMIDENAIEPLNSTRAMAAKLLAESKAAATPLGKQIYKVVKEALSRPGGLTVRGAQDLRTYVRNLQDSNEIKLGGTLGPGLERLEDALTDDYLAGAVNARLPQFSAQDVRTAVDNARSRAARYGDTSEQIFKLIGKEGDIDSARLVAKLTSAAGTSSPANLNLLRLIKSHVDPTSWAELGAAIARRLGVPKGGVGEFSPEVYRTGWTRRLSEEGKDILYGPYNPYRQALDDIATIAHPIVAGKKFMNPSGTGRIVGGVELLTLLATSIATLNPLPFAVGAGGMGLNAIAGGIVSRPVTAIPTGRFARTLNDFYNGRIGQAGVRASAMELSRDLAPVFGVDPDLLNESINQQFNLGSQRASGGSIHPHAQKLHEIESASLSPEQKRDMRRKVIEDALRNP